MLRLVFLLAGALLVLGGAGVDAHAEGTCTAQCPDDDAGGHCPPNCSDCLCCGHLTSALFRVEFEVRPQARAVGSSLTAPGTLPASPDPRELLHVPISLPV